MDEREIEKEEKPEKVNMRNAVHFGYHIADGLSELLHEDNIPPTEWPVKFPFTIKEIKDYPEVGGNNKVAKKVAAAAKVVWKDMRSHAVEIQKDMELHPELYMPPPEMFDHEAHMKQAVWRHLSVAIEQIAGSLYLTEFGNEEAAKKNVYRMLKPAQLRKFMVDFEDDYYKFADEVREAIRGVKELPASTKLELICLINTSTKSAIKLIQKQDKIKKSA